MIVPSSLFFRRGSACIQRIATGGLARLVASSGLARLLAWVALAGAATMAPSSAWAGPVLERIRFSAELRVCIWPDYYGVTYRHPHSGELSGIDIDLAREFARELQVRLSFVDSSFATLKADVLGERCDIAMFAVGTLRERMEHLRFSRPYLRSGIYGIALKSSRVVREWADIDRPGVVVGVQAGTFMQPVLAQNLRHARLSVIAPPATREGELTAGRIDVFMTDYPYSRRLLENVDWARRIEPPEPFHPLPYAYAVKPGDEEWFQLVDQFVRRIQRDGKLLEAARRHGLRDIVVP